MPTYKNVMYAPAYFKLFIVIADTNIHKATKMANITLSHGYRLSKEFVKNGLLEREESGREVIMRLTKKGEKFLKTCLLLKEDFKNMGLEW